MEGVAGTRDDTGQADWLDVDGPASQARESLRYFKLTEVVLGLHFRDPLWCKDRPEGQARRWGQWEAMQSLRKEWGGLNWPHGNHVSHGTIPAKYWLPIKDSPPAKGGPGLT